MSLTLKDLGLAKRIYEKVSSPKGLKGIISKVDNNDKVSMNKCKLILNKDVKGDYFITIKTDKKKNHITLDEKII